MRRLLIDYCNTPQFTGLEYDEMRDLEQHPDKIGHYKDLVKSRTALGKDFETKAPKKKRKKSA